MGELEVSMSSIVVLVVSGIEVIAELGASEVMVVVPDEVGVRDEVDVVLLVVIATTTVEEKDSAGVVEGAALVDVVDAGVELVVLAACSVVDAASVLAGGVLLGA